LKNPNKSIKLMKNTIKNPISDCIIDENDKKEKTIQNSNLTAEPPRL